MQIRANAARGRADAVRRLLIEALGPTVETLIHSYTSSKISNEEFEVLADQLADEFMGYISLDYPPCE
jgi:antitoxin ParD1/3/4